MFLKSYDISKSKVSRESFLRNEFEVNCCETNHALFSIIDFYCGTLTTTSTINQCFGGGLVVTLIFVYIEFF